MSLFKRGYKIYIKCTNCGAKSEIKVPKGISVTNFVKGGSCMCENCRITFFPEEYTTDFFEKDKKGKETQGLRELK